MRTEIFELKKAADYEVIKTKKYPVTHDAEAGRFSKSDLCGGYDDPRQVRAFGKNWNKDTTTGCIFESEA